MPRDTELVVGVSGFKNRVPGAAQSANEWAEREHDGKDIGVGWACLFLRRSHRLGSCLVPGDKGKGKVKGD